MLREQDPIKIICLLVLLYNNSINWEQSILLLRESIFSLFFEIMFLVYCHDSFNDIVNILYDTIQITGASES